MKKQNHSTFILVPSEILDMCGLGDIDIITDFFHFALVFQSETSKWLKSLYFTIIIRSFNLKFRPYIISKNSFPNTYSIQLLDDGEAIGTNQYFY